MIPFFVLVVPNGDDGCAVMLLLLLIMPPPPPRTLLPQAVVARHRSPAALLAVVSLISLSLYSLSTIISISIVVVKMCLNLRFDGKSHAFPF